MTVAVATLGCTRKRKDIFSWTRLLQLEGDYRLYINFEHQTPYGTQDNLDDIAFLDKCWSGCENQAGRTIHLDKVTIDTWNLSTAFGSKWKGIPRFDQDHARIASIVFARNMAIEFAKQTDATHLLFIDADIVPSVDIIPKMLAVDEDAVCGLVNGRGVHSGAQYIFQPKRDWIKNGIALKEVEHANIGFTMLSKKLFWSVAFRYGVNVYPDGTTHVTSDDPCYHLDAFYKHGTWPQIRMDVVGQHCGELTQEQVAPHDAVFTGGGGK